MRQLQANLLRGHFGYSVISNGATHVRIISKAFPWSIEIMPKSPSGMPTTVTLANFWDALFAGLHEPLEDSEWGLAVLDKKLMETIEQGAKARKDAHGDTKFRRIDWLGDQVLIRGLEKDEEFIKLRLFPGAQPCAETWILKLDS
jgi:hypothetical protein